MILGVIMIAVGIIVFGALSLFGLTQERMHEIRIELEARRGRIWRISGQRTFWSFHR